MQQALSIPEIKAQIGEFLDSKSLSICTRVSKAWSAAFGTILYHHVSILAFNRHSPSIPVLKRHAHQTFSLTLTLPVDLGYFTLKCPSLRALHLNGLLGARVKTIAGYETRGHRKALALIQQHQQTLRSVAVGLLWPIAKSLEFWTSIAMCPRLETLLVRDEKMFVNNGDHSEQEAFWIACTKARNLTLKNLRFQAAVNVPAWLDFSRVRKLELLGAEWWHADKQVLWMGRCSELRILNWTPLKTKPHVVGASALTTFPASWPKLRELTLSGQEIKDHDLVAVISTAEVLVKLSVPQTQFGRRAFAALRTHHFQVLRLLNLQDCESATSAMVQEVMASCPGLEYLRAPLLRSVDVLVGAPWVCLKLKQLQLETFFLDTNDTDKEVQKVALAARFSALKEVSLVFPHNLSIIR
ncbi:hypothetical protein BGZ93_002200 [Podila epicladia]|nr:hypothetical protein BGZ92_006194 [Podila epicladia]KAG0100331.1 hypothetical protein BGZ93_002200 [Podila epicladia]